MSTRYTVTYAPRAQRDLRKLPEKIATACVEFIGTVLVEEPYRVGKPLTSSWEGYYSARRSEWRIIYRIDNYRVLIEVVTIAHRASPTGHADLHGGADQRHTAQLSGRLRPVVHLLAVCSGPCDALSEPGCVR